MKTATLRNSDDARRLGKEGIPFKEAVAFIREFEEFNPYHILPPDRAKKYLDENWGGKSLDIQHFGFKPRPRKKRKEPFKEKKQ